MNLQKFCLQVIAEAGTFERYYPAIRNCEDAGLKRQLEFLQRRYSNEIAAILFPQFYCTFEKVPDYVIDFLINNHLTMLETKWLINCSWENIIEKFAKFGSNLECIYWNALTSGMRWKDIMRHLRNLKIVGFASNCNDEILKGIATFCPNIVEIDAANSRDVTDTGINYLCMKENGKLCCPKLKKIKIDGSGVMEAGIAHLIKNLRSLEEIDCVDVPKVLYSLHKTDLSRLDRIEPYNINTLNFFNLHKNPFFTDILKICFSICPRLKSLHCNMLKEEHLELFASLNELEKLDVKFNSRSVDINNLLKLAGRKLTSLSVRRCSLSLSNVVKSCPCLINLRLFRINFQNSSDISPVVKRLKTDVSTSFVNETAQSVSSVLEEILLEFCDCSSNEFKDEFLVCVQHSPIKNISILRSYIDIKFLKDILVNCYSLKNLTLRECELLRVQDELCSFAKLLPNNPEIHIFYFHYDIDSDDESEEDDDDNHHPPEEDDGILQLWMEEEEDDDSEDNIIGNLIRF